MASPLPSLAGLMLWYQALGDSLRAVSCLKVLVTRGIFS